MRILFVTPTYPDEGGAGLQRRAAQHIRALARAGEVTVILPWRPAVQRDVDAVARCLALGAVTAVERTMPTIAEDRQQRHASSRNRLTRAWRALLRRSHLDGQARGRDMATVLQSTMRNHDLMFAFRMESATWAESVFGFARGRRVVDFDDVESMLAEQVLGHPGHSRFWRMKLRRQLPWIRRQERRLAARWSAFSVCSELDARRFHDAHGQEPWIVPTGYRFGTPLPPTEETARGVLFVGTFVSGLNVEGVRWLANTVWPRVIAALDESITLTLAGFSPPPEIRALGERPGITVIADAPDLDPLYERANIVIAPLLAGSGTRIKLIEAAARGRAIVTTAIGCEGLDFVDGVHAEIADTPEAFAAAVVRLARDPARRAALAAAAYDHARELFDTERIEAELAERIRGLVGE